MATRACLACGLSLPSELSEHAATCPDCGVRVAGPAGGGSSCVGALLHDDAGPRLVVAEGADAASMEVIDAGGRYGVVAASESELLAFDDLARGGLYRMIRMAETHAPGLLPAAEDHIRTTCARDTRAGRRLAVDAVQDARWDLPGMAGVPRTERAWLRVVSSAQRGELETLVYATLELPEDRYGAKCELLWRAAEVLVADRYLAAQVARHLRPFSHLSPASVLLAVLEDDPNVADTIGNLFQTLPTAAVASTAFIALTTAWQVVESGPSSVTVDLAQLDPRLGTIATVLMSLGGPATDRVVLDQLDDDTLGQRLIDDLIDAGADDLIGTDVLGHLSVEARRLPARRIARMAEARQRRDDLRRGFLDGDRNQLEQAGEAGRFYLLLLDLIGGDREALRPLQELVPPRGRELLDELAGYLHGGGRDGSVPDALVSIPPFWPLLVDVMRERWRTRPPRRLAEASMYRWWVSHEAVALIERWQFADALELVEATVGRADAGPVRDDLLTLAACLHHHLGDREAAIRRLEGRSTTPSSHDLSAVERAAGPNPYLVFGLFSGCETRDISRAYARRRRLVNTDPMQITDRELNKMESALTSIVTGRTPDSYLHTPRPASLPHVADLGVLAELEPALVPPERSTQPLGLAFLTELVAAYAHRAIRELVRDAASELPVPRFYPAN